MFDTLTSAQKIVLAAVVLLALAAALVSASGRLRPAPDAADGVVGYDPPIPGAELVTVHVAGAVMRPGVYRLDAGSRVQDAVSAAGGFASDARADSVNLASWLSDGEQVFIETLQHDPAPIPDARPAEHTAAALPADTAPQAHMVSASAAVPPPSPARPVTPRPVVTTSPAPVPAQKQKVCINTAGLDELQQLPGIGPALAKRILYYRYENGRFRSFNQLGEVDGIGPQTIEGIRACSTLN